MPYTYAYPVPVNPTNSDMQWATAEVIGTEIWIFTSTGYNNRPYELFEVFVFNTESSEMRKIEYTAPDQFDEHEQVASMVKDDQLYIWRLRFETNTMYKFDTKTRCFSHILSIPAPGGFIVQDLLVIDDYVYATSYEEMECNTYLYTIRFSDRKILSKTLIIDSSERDLANRWIHNYTLLFSANGKPLVLKWTTNKPREVYKVETDCITLLARDKFPGEEDVEDYKKLANGGIEYSVPHEDGWKVYNDLFDIKTLKWTRKLLYIKRINAEEERRRKFRSICVDGKMFELMDRPYINNPSCDLRVYEIVPKLSSACLMSIAKTFFVTEDLTEMDKVKNLLPKSMSDQLCHIFDWRWDMKMEERLAQNEKMLRTLFE